MEDLVEETPDGILVTGGDATRNHALALTVRVTMNAQREDPILLDKLREFRDTMRKRHELYVLCTRKQHNDVPITDVDEAAH